MLPRFLVKYSDHWHRIVRSFNWPMQLLFKDTMLIYLSCNIRNWYIILLWNQYVTESTAYFGECIWILQMLFTYIPNIHREVYDPSLFWLTHICSMESESWSKTEYSTEKWEIWCLHTISHMAAPPPRVRWASALSFTANIFRNKSC